MSLNHRTLASSCDDLAESNDTVLKSDSGLTREGSIGRRHMFKMIECQVKRLETGCTEHDANSQHMVKKFKNKQHPASVNQSLQTMEPHPSIDSSLPVVQEVPAEVHLMKNEEAPELLKAKALDNPLRARWEYAKEDHQLELERILRRIQRMEFKIAEVVEDAERRVSASVKNRFHVLRGLFPPSTRTVRNLRSRPHSFQLPHKDDRNFMPKTGPVDEVDEFLLGQVAADDIDASTAEDIITVTATEDITVPAAEDITVPATEDNTVPAAENTTVPAAADISVPATEDNTVPAAENTTVPAAEDRLLDTLVTFSCCDVDESHSQPAVGGLEEIGVTWHQPPPELRPPLHQPPHELPPPLHQQSPEPPGTNIDIVAVEYAFASGEPGFDWDSESMTLGEGQLGETCSICYDSPSNCALCPCGHFACMTCIDKWKRTRRTCPFCRQVVKEVLQF